MNSNVKYIFSFFFIFFYAMVINVVAQNSNGNAAPNTHTGYHSEYIWLTPTKLKFIFYTQRACGLISIFSNKHFPDTCYFRLFVNNKRIVSNIMAFRDSSFAHPYSECAGLTDCAGEGNGSGSNAYHIFRYSGTVDFNKQTIKDTLDKLNACMVDIAFMGGYRNPNIASNFVSGTNTVPDSLYAYLQVNRCFKWKAGDRSPKIRNFQPFTADNLRQAGIIQIDMGYSKGDQGDSLNYLLTQPRKYRDAVVYYPFASNYSLSYYYTSYCPGGAPCAAAPEAKPPRGFYISPKTGVIKFYKPAVDNSVNINPILAVICESYKKDSAGVYVKVSSMVRNNINYVFGGTFPADLKVNTSPYVSDLDYSYYVCEEATDTIDFSIRDTLAKNQSTSDTIEYRWINEIPESSATVMNLGNPEPDIKIIWTPPTDSYLNSPYTFNIYANEKKCSPSRQYMFRSAEFIPVPRPKFKLKIDTTNCGKLRFSASTLQSDPFKIKWTIYNIKDTIKISSKLNDSVDLPYSGKWYIKLNVENSKHGCSDSWLDSILPVNAAIISSISKLKSKVCKGQMAYFSNLTKNNIGGLNYQWFRNGQIVSTASDYYTIINDTTKVKFIVFDKRNCNASDSVTITTFPEKTIYHLPDTSFCNNESINIKAIPPQIIDTITWMHNSSKTAVQSLNKKGTYILNYKDSNKCELADTFVLNEIEPLLVHSFNDISLCKNDTLKLNTPLNSNVSYDSILFIKDGFVVSRNYYPQLLFNQNALMNLTVFGTKFNKQCRVSDTFNVIIFPDSDIKIKVSSTDSCMRGNVFYVEKTGTTSISDIVVNWGDSKYENLSGRINHTYKDTGNYLIQLYIMTKNNCLDTSNKQVHVFPSPEIQYTLNDSIQCLENNLFILHLTSTSISGLKHYINWGDNVNSNDLGNGTYSHEFLRDTSSLGNKLIQIFATNNFSCKDSVKKKIEIVASPKVKIGAYGFCLGDQCFFDGVISNFVPIKSYIWQINNELVSTSKSYTRLLDTNSIHHISLNVLSDQNCSGFDSIDFTLIEKPVANFSYERLNENINGFPFHFFDRSSKNNTWSWYFGNTGSSSIQNPDFTFKDTGYTNVKLVVSNNNICYDSIEKILPVFGRVVFYFPDAFSPNENGINDGFGLNPNQYYLVKNYHIEIFNRWGEKVFETNDIKEHWLVSNSGSSFSLGKKDGPQQGIYLYKVVIGDIYNIEQELTGAVEVLR